MNNKYPNITNYIILVIFSVPFFFLQNFVMTIFFKCKPVQQFRVRSHILQGLLRYIDSPAASVVRRTTDSLNPDQSVSARVRVQAKPVIIELASESRGMRCDPFAVAQSGAALICPSYPVISPLITQTLSPARRLRSLAEADNNAAAVIISSAAAPALSIANTRFSLSSLGQPSI